MAENKPLAQTEAEILKALSEAPPGLFSREAAHKAFAGLRPVHGPITKEADAIASALLAEAKEPKNEWER